MSTGVPDKISSVMHDCYFKMIMNMVDDTMNVENQGCFSLLNLIFETDMSG